jgi:fumarate reductase flavoprotein subunit
MGWNDPANDPANDAVNNAASDVATAASSGAPIADLPDEVDVAVIGGGLAGHCAALAAAERGARVLLLEKRPATGGSTVLSGGFMAFADTPMQRAAGIDDNDALLLGDLRAVGGPEADEALLRAYVREQAGLYQWLTEHSIIFGGLELSAGQSVARSHQTGTQAMLDALAGALREYPQARLVTGARAVGLVRETVDGPVVGVDLETPSGVRRVRARGGVVLASGGFSRSEELLRLFAPAQADAVRIGGAGSTGDGLKLAWKLGAGLRDMGQIRGTYGTHPSCSAEKHEILLAFYLGAIIVNTAARRFIDESVSYKQLGDACLQQPGGVAYQLFDQTVMDLSSPGVALFDFQPVLDRGLLQRADTLDELAAQCGLDAATLQASVDRYNAGIDAGEDSEFGRDGLCHHAGARTKIECAPFYAYLSTTTVLATYCGLHADDQTRVRDVNGEVIAGLFAAGEIVGGFHGRSYMTGTSLGKAALFGRIAGVHAATRALVNQAA